MRIRDSKHVRWDLVSLGEVMPRLDPGESRIHASLSEVRRTMAGTSARIER